MLKDHLIQNGFLWGPEHTEYPISGFMAYPPVGKLLKSKIESHFKNTFRSAEFTEIETPIMLPEMAWQASGHLERMSDEMFQTKTSKGQRMIGRPEIATTIYPYFKALLQQSEGQMPIKVFQSGIVLPNDRQTDWQTRTRQYTAHEGHIIINPENIENPPLNFIDYLRNLGMYMMIGVGIPKEQLTFAEKQDEKPFYANTAFRIYSFVDGRPLELLGIQDRGNHDFQSHFTSNLPFNAYEISFSSDRPFIATLFHNFKTLDGNRHVLQLPDAITPIPLAITTKNKTGSQLDYASQLTKELKNFEPDVHLTQKGSLGNRYRRLDAQGVPFVVTIDDKSPHDRTFNLRERDSRGETRIFESELLTVIAQGTRIDSTAHQIRKLYQLAS